MSLLRFIELPRYVGNPHQTLVRTKEELRRFIAENNGRRPCFISLYSFKSETQLELDKIYFDFDVEHRGEAYDEFRLQKDVLSLVAFLSPYPVVIINTRKGYHAYIPLVPELMHREKAHKRLQIVQSWLTWRLGLTTADARVFGDERRITRIPNCYYVDSRNLEASGICCVPLRADELWFLDKDALENICKNPRFSFTHTDLKIPLKSIDELIHEYNMITKNIIQKRTNTMRINKNNLTMSNEFINKIFIRYPCVGSELQEDNPISFARFCAVIHLKKIGWDIEQIWKFFAGLGMRDFDSDKTAYHVEYIYRRYNMHPSCSSLKDKGLCLGDKCKRYRG